MKEQKSFLLHRAQQTMGCASGTSFTPRLCISFEDFGTARGNFQCFHFRQGVGVGEGKEELCWRAGVGKGAQFLELIQPVGPWNWNRSPPDQLQGGTAALLALMVLQSSAWGTREGMHLPSCGLQ